MSSSTIASAAIPKLEAENDDRALGRAWVCVGFVKGAFYCEYADWEEAAGRAVRALPPRWMVTLDEPR